MMSDQDNGPPSAGISSQAEAAAGETADGVTRVGGTAGWSRTESGVAARTAHSLDVTTSSGLFASRTGRT
jgi:hypothetical protein